MTSSSQNATFEHCISRWIPRPFVSGPATFITRRVSPVVRWALDLRRGRKRRGRHCFVEQCEAVATFYAPAIASKVSDKSTCRYCAVEAKSSRFR